MSAAAIPRMRARSVPYEAHEIKWEQIRQEEGYVRLPLSYGNVLRATSPLQQAILWNIIKDTLGYSRGRAPESVQLSISKLAKLTDTTPQGVTKALAGLEEMRVIRRSGSGRRGQYAPDVEQWRTVKPPPPRKLNRAELAEDDEALDDEQPTLVMKTSQPLVILPGSNSRPRPLSEVCHNTECEVLKGHRKGEPKANDIANAVVKPSEPQLQLQTKVQHTAATSAHAAAIAHLQERIPWEGFQSWLSSSKPVSLENGTLTLAVHSAGAVDWIHSEYKNLLPAAAKAAKVSRIDFIADTLPAEIPPATASVTPRTPTLAERRDELQEQIRSIVDIPAALEKRVLHTILAWEEPTPRQLFLDKVRLRRRAIAASGQYNLLPTLAEEVNLASVQILTKQWSSR